MEMTLPELFRSAFAFGLLEGWWLSMQQDPLHPPLITDVKC